MAADLVLSTRQDEQVVQQHTSAVKSLFSPIYNVSSQSQDMWAQASINNAKVDTSYLTPAQASYVAALEEARKNENNPVGQRLKAGTRMTPAPTAAPKSTPTLKMGG